MSDARLQIGALARRSVVRTLRQPGAIVPSLVFPLFFLAVVSAGARSAARLPGFPTDSYFKFYLAGPFLLGTLLAGANGGTDLAIDVESGFLNRLALTPVRRLGVIAGNLAGTLTVGLMQVAAFFVVGFAFGVRLEAGPGAIAVVVALALLISAAFGTLWAAVGLRTGSSEAVQGAFPLGFVVIGFSSLFIPRALISVRWFKDMATWNPASYLIEGLRSLVITGWDGRALSIAFAVASGLTVVGLAGASRALGRRFGR
jgi:ABC-2 type transport system permease protein